MVKYGENDSGDTSNQAANSTEGQAGGGYGTDPGLGSAPPQPDPAHEQRQRGKPRSTQTEERTQDDGDDNGDENGEEIPPGSQKVTLTGNWFDRASGEHHETDDVVIVDEQTARDLRAAGYAGREQQL